MGTHILRECRDVFAYTGCWGDHIYNCHSSSFNRFSYMDQNFIMGFRIMKIK